MRPPQSDVESFRRQENARPEAARGSLRPPVWWRLTPIPEDSMRHLPFAIRVAAVCGCDSGPRVTQPLAARAQLTAEPRFDVAYLPTLHGTRNRPSGISNNGLIAGFVNRPGNATRVAALG